MSNETESITFFVPGRREDSPGTRGVVAGVAREGQALERISAEPGDYVELDLVGGPQLILHPETAARLFAAQASALPSRSAEAPPTGAVLVPTRLGWPAPSTARSDAESASGAALRTFRVVKETLSSRRATIAAPLLAKRIDDAHPERLGLLTPNRVAPSDVTATPTSGRLLIFLHGTFSSTAGSFGKLWSEHPAHVRRLFEGFQGQIYGFDHPTLTASPTQNALRLVKTLARGTRLHLITHSRGGLVAEALARAASGQPLTSPELALFEGDAYADERRALTELYAEVAAREITVERVVRVACPTRGTLLASERLDAYLSVFKWCLELAGVPVAPSLVELLLEVAKRRQRVEELPGLEAMMPHSPFIRWLHHGDAPIPGEVRVVAGDIQGDSVASWAKTLMADAFFWTDNDLVVQTRSMYGGAPRQGAALFFLDRGGKTSHFAYFSNSNTAAAITSALLEDAGPRGFAKLGPLSAAGLDASGSRSGEAKPPRPDLPAIVLLPGILGSHLKVGEERVWLSCRIINGLGRLDYGLEAQPVAADGLLGPYYDELADYLSEAHDVIRFGYDWRSPVDAQARALGDALEQALQARASGGPPVHVLAHSMGGIVLRALEWARPDVWQRLMAQPDARLLMLGTPQRGSWAPMQVLSGDSPLGGLITSVGALFDAHKARRIFAGLPGFLQLQADLEHYGTEGAWRELDERDREGTGSLAIWHDLPWQHDATRWGIPSEAVLGAARELRRKLDLQDLAQHGDRIVIVLGNAKKTTVGVRVDERGVSYIDGEGDGTVALSDAWLTGIDAYQADADHAQLSRCKPLFPIFAELLQRGSTTRLRRARPPAASTTTARATPNEPTRAKTGERYRGFTPEVPVGLEEAFALSSASEPTTSVDTPALAIEVLNGNLTFVRQPLLLGHYVSRRLTGTEDVMDKLIGAAMSRALDLDDYPQQLDSNKVFVNVHRRADEPWAPPRPQAVIVVGMGEEGELRSQPLARSISRAVVSYVQQLATSREGVGPDGAILPAPTSFELAATLLGSGGMSVSVAQSALALAEGVRLANTKLFRLDLPTVSKLEIVELYEDRATEALRTLGRASRRMPHAYQVGPSLRVGMLPLRRPEDAAYRGADYDMISAVEGPQIDHQSTIEITIDTKRARSETRPLTIQSTLLQTLVRNAEAAGRSANGFGQTLFNVLVPPEMDEFFGNSDAVLLQVDGATAGIPWELLSTEREQAQKPWAIRTKLLRKRKSQQYRQRPNAAGSDGRVLVIGQPKCDPAYPKLAGAVREARRVAQIFGVEPLIDEDAATLVGALFRDPYRVVHIAGHGKETGAGVVLSDDTLLDGALIQRLRQVPDLVFINCCHSGREGITGPVGEAERALERGRPQFAATVATRLIEIGVRCVIATGWAVNDEAAEEFAAIFYEQLRRGETFRDAVHAAREEIWTHFKGNNTWAAYQCYGDPDFRLQLESGGATASVVEPERHILSPAELCVALQTTGNRGHFGPPSGALEKLTALEQRYGARWRDNGTVAEAFARAYGNLGKPADAVRWYELAAADELGRASQRAIEQLCNLKAREAAEAVVDAYQARAAREAPAEWTNDERGSFEASVVAARKVLQQTAEKLEQLIDIGETYERRSLACSAWKRRAIVEQVAELAQPGSTTVTTLEALQRLLEHARRAEELALAKQLANPSYARLNRLSAELLLCWYAADGAPKPGAEAHATVAAVRESLVAATREPDFFSLVQVEELKIYEALSNGALALVLDSVLGGFADLYARLQTPTAWASVRDQARFMLRPYAARATEAERSAAARLVSRLEAYAERPADAR